jgi:dienelactone hydrolase
VSGSGRAISRRHVLFWSASALTLLVPGCARHASTAVPCPGATEDFELVSEYEPRTVLRTGPPSGPAVVLLHELPGLSPADMGLARCLAKEGFSVYLPLLFGTRGQDNWLLGYFQSCGRSTFECSKLSTNSPILGWVRTVCRRVADQAHGPIAVIGMCLTGAFPLACLADPRVRGAILCQPTIPFSLAGTPDDEQKFDLGVDPRDLDVAVRSGVPILAMRYTADTKCPPQRMMILRWAFRDKVAVIELGGEGRHSTLAGNFDEGAFADVVSYLTVVLDRAPGPSRMRLARVGDRACEITAEGRWRVAP